ncbi:hypothetical protein [Chitinophaga polysaccharea]|uniref:hypothetical protein n=1 Tax=Chitinophaga polysaccharea TaxID=1293035 RepID=UPI0011A599FF|nr:hypothetical protein [Chitinophaga polysaccharea]
MYEIITDTGFDHEIDRDIQLLCCLEGKQTEHYENMLLSDLQQEIKKIAFLHGAEIPSVKPSRYFTVTGRTYKVLYDFRDLVAGQFIDAMACAKEPAEFITNMHRMLAAICRGTKRTWRGRTVLDYGAIPFEQVSEAMKQLPIVQAHATALFFCQLWAAFLKGIPDYLTQNRQTMAKEEHLMWTQALAVAGGG